MAAGETRFLIVILDALRPEFVTPDLMPNLHGFAADGVRFVNSRSTFPTETRVNQSAVTTGCYPARHGVVANVFPLPEAAPGAVLNTGDDTAFEPALARLGGRFVLTPTMGELLAAAGRSFATISAGTSGGGRLINIAAEATGAFRLAMRRPEAAAPAGVYDRITQVVGDPPAYEVPGIAWNSYAVDVYLDYVETQVRPDVMLLWLSEPDESFHYKGIGSPEALGAIKAMDAAFGRILERQAAEVASGGLQIVAMSDHGQISLRGEKLDIAAQMRAAGFDASNKAADDPDYLVVIHNGGGVWVRNQDADLTTRMLDWLRAQRWCGPVFTRDGVGGALRHSDIFVDHPRAADIVLALANDDDANEWGRAGSTADNAPYPVGGGCHGGLSRHELENFLALGGGVFRQGLTVATPAGNVDILPTVLAALNISVTHGFDGRVLTEAFKGGDQPSAAQDAHLTSGNDTGPVTHLSKSEVAGAAYLNRAWTA